MIAGTVTLQGSGQVTLSDYAQNTITGAAPTAALTNVNDSISGSGQLGDGELTLDNETKGVIDASGTNNQLVIDTGSGPFTNAGTIETTGAGGLVIENTTATNTGAIAAYGSGGLVIDNSTINGSGAGVVEALAAGSQVDLENAAINGGALKTANGGEIETIAGDSTVKGATFSNAGSVVVEDGTALTVIAINNTGTIALNSTGDLTMLALAANVTLKGGGQITLADVAPGAGSATNEVLADGATVAAPFSLTNMNNTILGAGLLGDGDATMKLTNQTSATIDANGANPLTIDTGNSLANAGTLVATGAGGLFIDDTLINTGMIEANGGNVTVGDDLSGPGKSEIFSSSDIELKGSSNKAAIIFENDTTDTGVLVLDHSIVAGGLAAFTGTVAGLYHDGTNSDTLDLQDINFASGVTWSFKENANGQQGVLSVKDHLGDTANVTLLGQYLAASVTETSATSSLFQTSVDHITNTIGTLIATNFR